MRHILPIIIFLLATNQVKAQTDWVELSGDIMHLALPGAAFGATIVCPEEKLAGSKQFIWAAGVSTVATYALKYAVNKERPNGESHAFPSGHASRAFMGAEFIRRKFGWKAGAPAYLLAGYTGYTRVHANKHDYWDILGGAAVGIASSYIFAKPFTQKVNLSFGRQREAYTLNFSMVF
ncbi:phosphatase PAP2 family protein [Perlabentimonas gracilis]|uniref:phosphatase PAP2 family protein n=1 Tax=Perlabentimonas gracilis TaxID=2715279 RepID=UPI00140D6576|nr:phosphatase PAP2 family protein [Perlabentimonas gracilis]NHB67697.1 phosphatase PAP2 family protein [Perlabentimonas gracilis]